MSTQATTTPPATAPAALAPDEQVALARLAADLVAIDSRSAVSNLTVADRIEAELGGFEVERLDYTDAAGVAEARAGGASRAAGRLCAFRPHGHGAGDRLARGPLGAAPRRRRACCTASAAST